MKTNLKPQAKKITVSSLKPRPHKATKHARTTAFDCPYCLSKLIVRNNQLACSGSQLNLWKKEFSAYSHLEPKRQEEYLAHISNKSQFLSLYELWLNGSLACDFTTKVYNPTPDFKIDIPDPMFIKKIEASLKRPLFENEKHGLDPLWEKNGNYYDEYQEGAEQVEIPLVSFPDEC